MIETAMLYELTRLVIPRDILPAHIEAIFQYIVELRFNLIWEKLIIIIKKCQIIAHCLATRIVTCGTPARTTASMHCP